MPEPKEQMTEDQTPQESQQTTPQETKVETVEGDFEQPTDLNKLLEEAPVVSQPSEEKPEEKESPSKEKAEQKQPAQKTETEEEKKTETTTTEEPVVKVGEQEYPVSFIEEALRDHQNRKAWQKNLTQRSQLAARIPDEQLELLLPYALAQKELPENIVDELKKFDELPKTFKIVDEDGYEIEVPLESLDKTFLESLKKAVIKEVFPEYQQIKQEYENLKSEFEQTKQMTEQQLIETGKTYTMNFMQEHPEVAVTVKDGEDIEEVLKTIMEAGPDHPEFENAQRFLILAKVVSEQGGTLDDAYKIVYGKKEEKKKMVQSIQEKQKAVLPERVGGEVPTKPEDEQFIETLQSSKGKKVDQMFQEIERGG